MVKSRFFCPIREQKIKETLNFVYLKTSIKMALISEEERRDKKGLCLTDFLIVCIVDIHVVTRS